MNTDPAPSPTAAQPGDPVDLTGLCRTWADSNGHIFTITRATAYVPDIDRDWDTALHGMSSNCTCDFLAHDGPMTKEVNLAWCLKGDMFGYDPKPRTVADAAPFVGRLLGGAWEHIEPVLDRYAHDGEFHDDDLWALDDLLEDQPGAPRTAFHIICEDKDHPHWPLVLRAMRSVGHTDATLIAAAIIDNMPADQAAKMSPTMAEHDRTAYIDAVNLLVGLSTRH